jgi:hypothetical protein
MNTITKSEENKVKTEERITELRSKLKRVEL